MTIYNLRKATPGDLNFLYKVSTEAMAPLRNARDFLEKTLDEYRKTFEHEKIQVIQYEGKDVGRLRVVRSKENIYIGGIQILPEFQGKGIGGAILEEIKKEADQSQISIRLEVQKANLKAYTFYVKLGFKETEIIKEDIVMQYSPES